MTPSCELLWNEYYPSSCDGKMRLVGLPVSFPPLSSFPSTSAQRHQEWGFKTYVLNSYVYIERVELPSLHHIYEIIPDILVCCFLLQHTIGVMIIVCMSVHKDNFCTVLSLSDCVINNGIQWMHPICGELCAELSADMGIFQ